MAKLKKEFKPVKEKINKPLGQKQQKPTKAVKPKKLKDRVKIKNNIKNVSDESITVKTKKVQGKPEANLNLNVNDDQLVSGIKALLQHHKTETKDLFDKAFPVFAQVTSIKIPDGPNRRIRLSLKHSLHTDGSEICLIVPDLKRGRRQDHDPTIEHYEELLQSKGITCIKRILPMRQIKVEYDQFELKRKLCGYYECFLIDSKISGHTAHLLGKEFFEKRKLPIPVRFNSKNLKARIEDAMRKVQMNLHSNGNSYAVQIGNSNMSPKILADNLKSCIEDLAKYFPGGWGNIRSVYVKSGNSIAVPVYLTLKSANIVPIPVAPGIRPKLHTDVRGELSTKLNTDITLTPYGDISIHKSQTKEVVSKNEENGASNSDEEDLMDEDEDVTNENVNTSEQVDSDNFNDSEDEEDDLATKAEKKYMKDLKTNKQKKVSKKFK